MKDEVSLPLSERESGSDSEKPGEATPTAPGSGAWFRPQETVLCPQRKPERFLPVGEP